MPGGSQPIGALGGVGNARVDQPLGLNLRQESMTFNASGLILMVECGYFAGFFLSSFILSSDRHLLKKSGSVMTISKYFV